MNIYIDRVTGKCTTSQSPLTYTVTVADNFDISKTVQVQEEEKQKVNDEGQLLYKIKTFENEEVGEVWSETTDNCTVTKTEPREVSNTYTDDEGVEHTSTVTVDEPTEWVENEPVMVPNIVNKTVIFADSPGEFTAEEILQARYQKLLDNSTYDYIIADAFLNEEDIDLLDKDHSANTGVALMQLLPKGQAKTKSISLEVPAANFELLEFDAPGVDIYLSGKKFIDGKLTLSSAVSNCTIKFVNTTDKPVSIKSYAIAY